MSEIRVDTISEKTSANGVSIDSVKLKDGTVDVNGVSDGIILDADADTTISAPTDDQIDFKIAGADDFTMTANSLNVLAGSQIAYGSGGAMGSLVADTFRLTTNLTTTDSDLTANLERADDTLAGHVGTAMSQSSGIFTFPVTGIYYVQFVVTFYRTGATRYVGAHIYGTANNGTAYDDLAYNYGSTDNQSADVYGNITVSCLFDCVNTSTHKVKFYVTAAANTTFYSDTNRNATHMQFIKVGET